MIDYGDMPSGRERLSPETKKWMRYFLYLALYLVPPIVLRHIYDVSGDVIIVWFMFGWILVAASSMYLED